MSRDRLHRRAPWFLLPLALGACEPGGDLPLPALHVDATVEVAENPDNPFAALVTATVDQDLSVWVEHGDEGSFAFRTDPAAATAGEPLEIQVLGLRAGREHALRLGASDGSRTWHGEVHAFTTAPLPADFPLCEVEHGVDPGQYDRSEAICTNAWYDHVDGRPVYFCVDRWGEPLFQLAHPDDQALLAVRALQDGAWASVADSDSLLAVFDDRGTLIRDYPPIWFEGRTRYEHHWIDMHETIQLTEGPWAGALAVITNAVEEWGGPDEDWLIGSGILVFDPVTDEVLWDWSPHGELGDGEPISPLLPYDRHGLLHEGEDWQHGNALLHGVEDDGGQYFWLSLRAQDWIIKVDVDSDEVAWRFGYEGDFALVDDLDADDPQPLPDERYMFHQHAPEFQARQGSRTRFLVFDNGSVRPGPGGEPSWEGLHSRVPEFELDEATMRATIHFDHGSPEEGADDHFFSDGVGDADRMPGGGGVVFVAGWAEPPTITEVSYPDGAFRWRLTCWGQGELYRVNFFPSLYDRTWWYGVER